MSLALHAAWEEDRATTNSGHTEGSRQGASEFDSFPILWKRSKIIIKSEQLHNEVWGLKQVLNILDYQL